MTARPWTAPHRDDEVLRALRNSQGRPLLLTGGTVVTGNPLLGDWQEADVLIGGSVIVGIGPGLLTAAGDDNMLVIDCAGTLVLPASIDFTTPHTNATLTPGQPADLPVLRLADTPETPAARHRPAAVTSISWSPADRSASGTAAPSMRPTPAPLRPLRVRPPTTRRTRSWECGSTSTTSCARSCCPTDATTRRAGTAQRLPGPLLDHRQPHRLPRRPGLLGLRRIPRRPPAPRRLPLHPPLTTSPPRSLPGRSHTFRAIGRPMLTPESPCPIPSFPPGTRPRPPHRAHPPRLGPHHRDDHAADLARRPGRRPDVHRPGPAPLHGSLSLHATPEQVTWTATSFGFAYAVGFLVVGPLTDRYGSRVVMTMGLVSATVATAAVSTAPDLAWAIALRMVQGLTAAAFAPAAFSYIAHHLAPQRRAMALACVTSGMLGAAVLMQIAAQAVAAGLGWRAVFLLSVALMALSLLPVHRTLRPTPRQDTGGLLHAFAAMPRLLRRVCCSPCTQPP